MEKIERETSGPRKFTEIIYTSSPTPSRLVHGPLTQSPPPPPRLPYTIFEHVTRPCPDESHFRQQQLSDHTIFVFSIWHGVA